MDRPWPVEVWTVHSSIMGCGQLKLPKGHPKGAYRLGPFRGVLTGWTYPSQWKSGRDGSAMGYISLHQHHSSIYRRHRSTLGHPSPRKGVRGEVWSVAFSPDGRTLASGQHRLHDSVVGGRSTGQQTATLEGHTDWVHSVAFSPDGKTLASGSGDLDSSIVGGGHWPTSDPPEEIELWRLFRGFFARWENPSQWESERHNPVVGCGAPANSEATLKGAFGF